MHAVLTWQIIAVWVQRPRLTLTTACLNEPLSTEQWRHMSAESFPEGLDNKDVLTHWSDSVEAWHGESCVALVLPHMRWLSSNLLIRRCDNEIYSSMRRACIKLLWSLHCHMQFRSSTIMCWCTDVMMKTAAAWEERSSACTAVDCCGHFLLRTGSKAVQQCADTLMWWWRLQQHGKGARQLALLWIAVGISCYVQAQKQCSNVPTH